MILDAVVNNPVPVIWSVPVIMPFSNSGCIISNYAFGVPTF